MNNFTLIPALTVFTSTGHVPFRDSKRRFRAGGPYMNVYGRVVIAVVNVATRRTSPFPDRQRQLVDDVAAGATSLATREEPINHQDAASHLVFELTPELTKRRIADATRQAVILDHSLYMQVFNGHSTEALGQIGCEHVQEALAAVADGCMSPGNDSLALPVVTAALGLSGESTLADCKPASCFLQVLRVFHLFPGGEGCKRRNPKVNTDNSLALAGRFGFGFDGDTDVPTASGAPKAASSM